MLKLFFLALALLSGCQNYSFSLNERELYSPQPLLSDIRATDEALRTCLKQAVIDQKVRAPAELTSLNCRYAGIKGLTGLEQFRNLEQLSLAHNKLTTIDTLLELSELRVVGLNNNQIQYAQRLLDLPHLESVNLEANDQLACGFAANLPAELKINLPKHCRD